VNDPVLRLLEHDENDPIPAEHEQRIREGLGALLPGATLAASEPTHASHATPTHTTNVPDAIRDAALRKWATIALVALAAGGAGFAAGRHGHGGEPATDSRHESAPPPTLANETTPTSSIPLAASTPPAETSAEARREPALARSAALPTTSILRSGATSSADPFDREESLLERARSALGRHDAAQASQALAEWERRFPNSPHREDRDYLDILIHRERGEPTGELARQFLVRYPNSLFRSRVAPLAE
jgi:hypothetical protein